MDKTLTLPSALFALALGALCLFAGPASALDPVLAKICREKAIEAHPPKPAGSSTGHAKAQRDYYNACIAKGGKMDPEPQPDSAAKSGSSASPPPASP
jgi:hypothetical protein